MRVLLVEDDLQMWPILRRILRRVDESAEIVMVSTVAKARTELMQRDFALVITDYWLNGSETGVDLWKYCMSEHPDTEVVIISGTQEEVLKRESGLSEVKFTYLAKPVRLHQYSELFGAKLLRAPA